MIKRIVAIALCISICICSGTTAWASQNMSKGLLVQGYDTLDDAKELGVQEILFNITSNNWNNNKAANVWLLDQMAERGFKLTVVILKNTNVAGAHYEMLSSSDMNYVNDIVNTLGNKVSRYVIGNEINSQLWNYAGNLDCISYCQKYADIFSQCYNTIKTANPSAEVYIPFNYGWYNESNNTDTYSGREMLQRLSGMLPKDMDWGIAWHPYPDPIGDPQFNDDALATDDTYSYIVNFKNLHVLTDYMQTAELLKADGTVRNLILSEQGFSSRLNGVTIEEQQAKAFAESWNIAAANPYVKSYILSRQVDAVAELNQGYAFGLWNCDGSALERPTTKKAIWETFKNVGTGTSDVVSLTGPGN